MLGADWLPNKTFTWGNSKIFFTPFINSWRYFALSLQSNNDRRIEASWTKQDNA